MKEDIQAGNILIDEFVDPTSNKWSRGLGSKLQYHTSWEWLHPVLEKIWSLGAWEYEVSHGFCSINGDHEAPPYIGAANESTITAAWQSVIQFIQWYNLQSLNKT